jgi:hypothetical protein
MIFAAYYCFKSVISGVLDTSSAYSPECVEGGFCELPLYGVLRSSTSAFTPSTVNTL